MDAVAGVGGGAETGGLVDDHDPQWEAKRATFPFPANRLTRAGVSRSTRRRALCELAAAGLIIVERRHGRPPLVTINVL